MKEAIIVETLSFIESAFLLTAGMGALALLAGIAEGAIRLFCLATGRDPVTMERRFNG